MSPLDNQDPLAQLNDILAPTAASFWPFAAIYWFLLVVFIAAITSAFFLYKKYKKQHLKQRLVLQKLQQLKQSKASFIQLNQLLKGAALLYFPRQDVASLHGEAWFDFLQTYSKTNLFDNKQVYVKRLYNSCEHDCSNEDFSQAEAWIKSLNHKITILPKSV